MLCLVADEYEDVMSWIRAIYSRRELVFSLVEMVNDNDDDDDLSVVVIDDSVPTVTGSSIRQTATPRRRNASLKVWF